MPEEEGNINMIQNILKTRNLFIIFLVLIIPLICASCKKKENQINGQKKLNIITTLFPVYDFTRNISGDKAHVSLLLPPGVEPHGFEPKPGDMLNINSADIFIYTGMNMEPWVEGILKGVGNEKLIVVDTSTGITFIEEKEHDKGHHTAHGHGKIDPHVWLDFSNACKMVDNILDGLVRRDAANKDYYNKNASIYKAKLNKMDDRYRAALSSCKGNTFIHGGHFAFDYLAKRYNLNYIAAYHGSPNSEPTPRRLIELKNKLKKHNIKYIYYEELILPRISRTISLETGATMLKLHGAHNLSREDMENNVTFLNLMEENLKNLKVGLECQ